jgi:hypothetical protein
MKKWIGFIAIATVVLMMNCKEAETQQTAAKSKVYNPNGDSELALLMRQMFDECLEVKSKLDADGNVVLAFDPEEILTAHATEPAKAASATYKEMSKVYLDAHQSFMQADPQDRKDKYQALVVTCIACHQQLCPGPIRKINRLLLTEL